MGIAGVIFVFPEDARWIDSEEVVEFDLRFVPWRVFQGLSGAGPKAEECIECFHLNRTDFERVTDAKIRARQRDWDAKIRFSGRDLTSIQAVSKRSTRESPAREDGAPF